MTPGSGAQLYPTGFLPSGVLSHLVTLHLVFSWLSSPFLLSHSKYAGKMFVSHK